MSSYRCYKGDAWLFGSDLLEHIKGQQKIHICFQQATLDLASTGEYQKQLFKTGLTPCKCKSKVQDQNESQSKALINISILVEWFLTFLTHSWNVHVNFSEKNGSWEKTAKIDLK